MLQLQAEVKNAFNNDEDNHNEAPNENDTFLTPNVRNIFVAASLPKEYGGYMHTPRGHLGVGG